MFQKLHSSGRRVSPHRRSALLLSVAAHLAVIALLVRLPPAAPPTADWSAEEIAWMAVLSSEAVAEPETRPAGSRGDRPAGPPVASDAGLEDAGPVDLGRVPMEIPSVEARLASAGVPGEGEGPGVRPGGGGVSGLLLDSLSVTPTALFPFAFDGSRPIRYPRLRNRDIIIDLLGRLYPARLQYRRLAGEVTVRFVIDARGRVDPATIRLIAFDREEFGPVALRVVERFRFFPARYGDEPVPILIEMPIRWVPGG